MDTFKRIIREARQEAVQHGRSLSNEAVAAIAPKMQRQVTKTDVEWTVPGFEKQVEDLTRSLTQSNKTYSSCVSMALKIITTVVGAGTLKAMEPTACGRPLAAELTRRFCEVTRGALPEVGNRMALDAILVRMWLPVSTLARATLFEGKQDAWTLMEEVRSNVERSEACWAALQAGTTLGPGGIAWPMALCIKVLASQLYHATNDLVARERERVLVQAERISGEVSAVERAAIAAGLVWRLHPHQIAAIDHLQQTVIEYGGGCVAIEMGMGKTLTGLEFLNRRGGVHLIAVPAPSEGVWKDHAQRAFDVAAPCRRLRMARFSPNVDDLVRTIMSDIEDNRSSYVLCSHEHLRTHVGMYAEVLSAHLGQKISIATVLIDESHVLRGQLSRTADELARVRDQIGAVVMSTGTPFHTDIDAECEQYQRIIPSDPQGFMGTAREFVLKMMFRTPAGVAAAELPPINFVTVFASALPDERVITQKLWDVSRRHLKGKRRGSPMEEYFDDNDTGAEDALVRNAILHMRRAAVDYRVLPEHVQSEIKSKTRGLPDDFVPGRIFNVVRTIQMLVAAGIDVVVFSEWERTLAALNEELKHVAAHFREVVVAERTQFGAHAHTGVDLTGKRARASAHEVETDLRSIARSLGQIPPHTRHRTRSELFRAFPSYIDQTPIIPATSPHGVPLNEMLMKYAKDLSTLRVVRIDGTTTPSPRDKDEAMRKFRASEQSTVALCTIGTMGTGVDLTKAGAVIFMEPGFNPQMMRQAYKRVHRPGQTKEVYVFGFCDVESCEAIAYGMAHTRARHSDEALGNPVVGDFDGSIADDPIFRAYRTGPFDALPLGSTKGAKKSRVGHA